MKARRLDNDRLLVQMRAEGPGSIIGDGMVGIGPDHPDYEGWLPHLEETDTRRTEHPAGRLGESNPEAR